MYHYFRKEYSEAVELFKKSLELNSFQLETLLRLGYSAIQIEAWDVAASTYWKYCSYETEVSI
jgi:tetratricopeptide (TPR) repeat protein